MFAFFLSSGLFLGWSLGANDASNVFGTAVGSKMIRFRTAAVCCSVFIVLGAVISGAGASHTLGKLGSVNAVAGAFIVAFAAAVSVFLMTRVGYPVSTSQAIVGAIIGWNLFSGSLTDYESLRQIVGTWVACPLLSGAVAALLYKTLAAWIPKCRWHMLTLDAVTRRGLLLMGAFGSYSLGANNIANVMGVFVPVSPFSDISILGWINLTSAQQLFFIGGVAISVGVLTYSRRVMETVGGGLFALSPVAAFVVVTAHSVVLFLFASQGLERFLVGHGLPAIPLVPVSSSQAIVGAVIGIGLLKGGRGIRWRTLGGIAGGWVLTPAIAAAISFVSLFFLQNVFVQKTFRPVRYALTPQAVERVQKAGVPLAGLEDVFGKTYSNARQFQNVLEQKTTLSSQDRRMILAAAEIHPIEITRKGLQSIDGRWISGPQKAALDRLEGRRFVHKWLLEQSLADMTPAWQLLSNDPAHRAELKNKLTYLHNLFTRSD